jgi:hypothetical protein
MGTRAVSQLGLNGFSLCPNDGTFTARVWSWGYLSGKGAGDRLPLAPRGAVLIRRPS